MNSIRCEPFNAWLTHKGCRVNQEMALTATIMLREGLSIYLIDRPDLDRLFACGRCPNSSVRLDMVAIWPMLKESVQILIDKIENMEWDRHDPDVIARNLYERRRRYRESHKDEIKGYMRIYRMGK